MSKPEQVYAYFFKALKYMVSEEGYAQNILAIESGKSEAYISQILNKKRNAPFKTQVILAKVCGYTYEDFLALGRRLLEGVSPEPKQPPPAHIPKLRRISDRTGEGDTREGIISLFDDRETARQIILQLVKIEKTDREYFVAVRSYVQGILDALDIKKEA